MAGATTNGSYVSRIARRGVAFAAMLAGIGAGLLAGSIIRIAPPPDEKPPLLTAEPLDLGRVRVQEAFPWTVTIRNATREPVQVYDLLSSCSCTKIEPRSFIVPAEGRVDVQITIDLTTVDSELARRPERAFSAELRPWIAVPEGIRWLPWELSGMVESAVALEPTQLLFPETLIRGLPWGGKSIVVRSLEPVESISAQCDTERARVHVAPAKDSPGAWKLHVTPSEALPVGMHEFEVYVQATLPGGDTVPPIPLPVAVTVIEDIRFWPSVVLLSARQEGESVSLRSRTNRAFEVLSATALSPELIETLPIEPSGEPNGVSNWLISMSETARETASAQVIGPKQTGVRFLVRYRNGRDVEITLPVQFAEP